MSQKFKVVFVGDQSSGKTSLVRRYMYDTFEENVVPTIGMDFQSKNVTLSGGRSLRLQLWDTAGQERFRSLIPSYMRDAAAAVVVYDITSRATFEAVQRWVDYIRAERGDEALLTLVGNKLDLAESREVSFEEGAKLAEDLGVPYKEASAKAGDNVVDLFAEISSALADTGKLNLVAQQQPGPTIALSATEQTQEAHRKKKAKCQC